MKRDVPWDERLELSSMIEDYHRIFFVFLEMSSISFTDEMPTACVRFFKEGKPELLLNEEFWNSLSIRGKLFVICHECMHVILNHGVRNGLKVPGSTPRLVNIAQDITINEMIVDLFNYDREDLEDWKKYCWIDTCFKTPHLIARNETFLYYLQKLIETPPESESNGGPSTVDDHDGLGDLESSDSISSEEKKNRESIAASLGEELSPKEISDIMKALPQSNEADSMSGILEAILKKKTKPVKINFPRIIQKLKKNSMKYVDRDVETFIHEDRRFNDVINIQKSTIPGKSEIEYPKQDRLITVVFMDISGSCLPFMNTFEKIFLAFDKEKKIFDTRLFIFDTKIKEVKPGDNIYIGGGTFFHIIEDKCKEIQIEKGRYPDCVVVITDGHGTKVEPKAPSNWIWLLTPKDNSKQYIPKSSKIFGINQIMFD